MLTNPLICRIVAWGLLAVGGYLAIFNTIISAFVIGKMSGLGLGMGGAIALALTSVELWFASWASDLTHWQTVTKLFRRSPEKTALKLFAAGIGLVLVYHFDIESTRLGIQSRSLNTYFFLWGLAWLILGPEIAISLHGWLLDRAKKAESKAWKENNSRDAERQFLRSERTTMLDVADEAGKQSAIRKVAERHGPKL
jgi:hypothetical protein